MGYYSVSTAKEKAMTRTSQDPPQSYVRVLRPLYTHLSCSIEAAASYAITAP